MTAGHNERGRINIIFAGIFRGPNHEPLRKIAQSLPILADGANPRPPMRPEVKSLRISPFMLVVTITSKISGSLRQLMRAIVDDDVGWLRYPDTLRNFFERALEQTLGHFQDIGFGGAMDFLCVLRRAPLRTRAARFFSQPFREISFKLVGDTRCFAYPRMPAYKSSTFSRTMIMSIPRPLNGVFHAGQFAHGPQVARRFQKSFRNVTFALFSP